MHRLAMNRRILVAVIGWLVLSYQHVSADEASEQAFWSHRFAMNPGVPYGEDPAQYMDVYMQGSWIGPPAYFEAANVPRPTLIWIHGGAWQKRVHRGSEILFLHFVERGWNVFSITYRLGPGTAPMAVDDALCALKFVADKADEWPIDRNRIVVAGASAGGHLALTTGILGSRVGHECYPGDGFKVAAIVNWFGVTDIASLDRYLDETTPEANSAAIWVGDKNTIADISSRYSPVNILYEDMPPVITIHGDADRLVPHSQALALHEKLQALGVENELLTIPGGKHAGFSDSQWQQAFRSVFGFLDRFESPAEDH